jgi:hypothetical protein
MAISNKSTVFAVVEEVSEGTIAEPNSGSDFLPIQTDLDMSPEIEKLDNEEMKASLGMAKKITGRESPTASFSHYVKHSGVEGQEPAWGKLIKSCLGAVDVASTEYQTASSSTTTTIKVADTNNFMVGQPLLIKDATNGYKIAHIHDIPTATDLTLGFKISAAPAAGVNLGKAVTYYPINTMEHPSLSLWNYIGNGGAKELIRGARVTEIGITADAGALINASISLEGLEFFFNQIAITSANKYLDFTDDAGTFAAVIPTGYYKTPHELASAIKDALNGVSTEIYNVVFSNSTGKFTIETLSSTLSLLWQSGTNTANTIGSVLGFDVLADSTGDTEYVSDNAQTYSAPYTPSFDVSDPLTAKGHIVYVGDQTDNVCFNPSRVSITITSSRKVIDSICSDSGISGSIINGREVKVSVKGLLERHDADRFNRALQNKDTRFMYTGGLKSGGNWVAGKCFSVYLPYCTVDSPKIGDDDSLTTIEFELSAFVPDDGSEEVFLGFV